MGTLLKSKMGSLFMQKVPGYKPEFVDCTDVDPLAAPPGDQTLVQCRNRDAQLETVGANEGAAGAVTTGLTSLVYKERSFLDELRNCPIALYFLQAACGQRGQFTNWVRAKVAHHARFGKTWDNVVKRETDAESTVALAVTAWQPVYDLYEVVVRQQSIAETTDLADLAFCNSERCAGACGEAEEPGTDGVAVGDAPASSPASKADVWSTDDGGDAWANITGGAGHPFAVGEDIASVVCFPIDATTWRWLVARKASGADHAEIAYSDDGGATWTAVEVGSVDGEGAIAEGALFAFDRDHIWFATDAGNVYFSDDGGLTWTLQDEAATADGANDLYVVKFSDYDHGWAVGAAGSIIQTTDGGDTWQAVTPPTALAAATLTALHAFSQHRLIVGANNDGLYQSWDEGDHWTAKTFTGQSTTGTVAALDFLNDYLGMMLHNPAAGQGYVHRTIDGGHTWQRLETPANAGLNAQALIGENEWFVCGNAYAGTGVILHVS